MRLAVNAFTENRQGVGDLIEDIYVAAAQPEHWNQVLHSLVRLTRSRSSRLLVLDDSASNVLRSIKVNTDDAAHQRYVDYYVNTCPWRTELGRKRSGRLYSTSLHFGCDQKSYYRTEFYNDWARELDIHHGVCGTIDVAGNQTVQLLIQRTRGQGHYTELETDAINTLIPHFRRALFINRSITAEFERRDAVTAATQQHRLPYFLLNADGRVCFISPDAHALVQSGVVPAPSGGMVQCEFDGDTQRVRQLVRGCLGTATGRASSAGGDVLARRRNGGALRLMVMPIHPDMGSITWIPGSGVFAAVYIHDPSLVPDIDETKLSQIYNLTDAEARVAAAVARGHGPEDLAETLTVSVHTVRTQLKAAMRKTGARRQSELARQVLLSPSCRPGALPSQNS